MKDTGETGHERACFAASRYTLCGEYANYTIVLTTINAYHIQANGCSLALTYASGPGLWFLARDLETKELFGPLVLK